MPSHLNDPLLTAGKGLALVLQILSALAGGILLLLVPIVVLISQGVLTGFFEGNDTPIVVTYPLPGAGLLFFFGLMFVALFLFFRKMQALIGTVGDGDPFTPENAHRLNAMAGLVLGIQVAGVVVAGFRHHLASLALGSTSSESFIDFGRGDIVGILMVIILFILARVFRHGAAMREDLEGTV